MSEQILLQQVPLFASLPPDEIHYLASLMHRRTFPAGEVIFWEGETGDRFSIVMQGQVDILKSFGTAEERLLATIGPGDFLGEVSLFDPDGLRSASVRARTQVQLLEMTNADFDALIHRQPPLAITVLRELSLRLRNTENATIRDLQEKNRQLAQAYRELQAAQAQIIEKEKIEHELQVARKIQEKSLPKDLPILPGWQISAYWQPARAVSGDFYDFITFPDGRLGVFVGDVTDKGVPASLVMAATHSVLRATARQFSAPGEILAQANEVLCLEMPPNMFVTCLIAVLDPASGEMRYANAGHNLPYKRTAQIVVELRATGMPLGLLPGMVYEEEETLLADGDSLLIYSDGLVEAHNPHKEMFGIPRLRDLLACPPGSPNCTPCSELIALLLNELAAFTGPGWEQEDDITFVTLERDSA
jgi:serine phosphatase RsbU (regulator of sigma subunit)